MPKTLGSASPALSIGLDHPQDGFAPGDTIIGFVSRAEQLVSPSTKITITLHGRAKSKKTESSSNGTTTSTVNHRGRFTLIGGVSNTYTLHNGPVHIAPGSDAQRWPFAVTLPTHADRRMPGIPQDQSYVPVQGPPHPLPATFHAVGCWRDNAEGFVEYFLQATIHSWVQGSAQVQQATLPIRVVAYVSMPPIVDFRLFDSGKSCTVASQRLVPGMEDAKLSLAQKTKKLFGTSSVPNFTFRLQAQIPTVIQIGNPKPFPFKLQAIPSWQNTSEIIQDVPQKIKLTELIIQIKSITDIICEGTTRNPHRGSISQSITLARAAVKDTEIPFLGTAPPLDVGYQLGLGVKGRSPSLLSPCFTTYNIRHSNRLSWEIQGQVAGETFKVAFERPITILPPSDNWPGSYLAPLGPEPTDTWIQPPPDNAPPTFTDVRRDDRA